MSLMVFIISMNVQDVDLNLLRVFDAVLHEGGVTPAATRLGLTQPAVSNALARLRGVFNDALFVRTPGGMDATPFARQLAEPVRQALALLESALAHGPGFDPATSTRAFRFYMSDLGQIEFLPPLIERVQASAPGGGPPAAGPSACGQARRACASRRRAWTSRTSAPRSPPGRSTLPSASCRGWAGRCAARRCSAILIFALCAPTTRSNR